MILNLQNIETLIFLDSKIKNLLPEFSMLFEQWKISKRVPGLKTMGQQCLIDLLNSLENEQLLKLEEYFGEGIVVEPIDAKLIANHEFDLVTDKLCSFEGYQDFCISRKKDKIKITFWK